MSNNNLKSPTAAASPAKSNVMSAKANNSNTKNSPQQQTSITIIDEQSSTIERTTKSIDEDGTNNNNEGEEPSTPTRKDDTNNSNVTNATIGISPVAQVLFEEDDASTNQKNKYGIEDWELENDENMYPLEVAYDDSMLRLSLISERPEHMEPDFYELEYIGWEHFSEFLRIFHDRKHVRGIIEDDDQEEQEGELGTDNPESLFLMTKANTAKFFEKIRSFKSNNSRFDELVAFSLIHQACNGISAAFRHVLKKKQIDEIMSGPGAKKNKKKGINFDELPPVIPNKSTILRVHELRAAFKESEKVSGPLLPFALGASLVKRQHQQQEDLGLPSSSGGLSRWKEAVPVSCFL